MAIPESKRNDGKPRIFQTELIREYKDEKDRNNILSVEKFIRTIDKIYGAALELEGEKYITVEFAIHKTVDIKRFISELSQSFIKEIEISVQEIKEKGNKSQGPVVILWIHFYKDQFMKTENVEKRKVDDIEREYKNRMEKYKNRKKYVNIPEELSDRIEANDVHIIKEIIMFFVYRSSEVDLPKTRFVIPHNRKETTKIRIHVPDSHFRVSFDFFRLVMSKFRGKVGQITVDPFKSHIEIEFLTNAKRARPQIEEGGGNKRIKRTLQ